MALDHDRATGCKGGGGIATSDRECQREVRRTKHRHRANRALHQTQVRTRQGGAIRKRFVMTAIQIITGKDMAGKQAKLANRTTALPIQARFRQAGFLGTDFGDFRTAGIDFIGDPIQELSPFFAGGIAIGPECVFGGPGSLIDQGRGADRESIGRAMGWFGLEGLLACDPLASNQMFSCQVIGHEFPLFA